jgi:hypothetical protein
MDRSPVNRLPPLGIVAERRKLINEYLYQNERSTTMPSANYGQSKNCIPPGTYPATLAGVNEVRSKLPGKEHETCWEWLWKITAAPLSGKLASRLTGDNPTMKSACGRFLTALFGRLPLGQAVDPNTKIGTPCIIEVQWNEAGTYTRVETFRLESPAAPAGGSIPF